MPLSPQEYCKKRIFQDVTVYSLYPNQKIFHQASNFLVRSSSEDRLIILGMLTYRMRISYRIQDLDNCVINSLSI